MKKILLSQSKSKALGVYHIDNDHHVIGVCPRQVYYTNFADPSDDKYRETVTTEAMMYGKFGETLMIGGGRDGERIEDLPRMALTQRMVNENTVSEANEDGIVNTGKKKISQIRIERQAEVFKYIAYKKGIIVSEFNTQVKLIAKYGVVSAHNGSGNVERVEVWLHGDMDIFPMTIQPEGMDDHVLAIGDIKITADVDNKFFNRNDIPMTSNACWGSWQHIAKNQPLFYHFIVRNFVLDHQYKWADKNMVSKDHIKYDAMKEMGIVDRIKKMGDDIPFIFLVFGYKKDPAPFSCQYGEFIYTWDSDKKIYLDNIVKESVNAYLTYEKQGWTPVRGKWCSKCPLSKYNNGWCNEAINANVL